MKQNFKTYLKFGLFLFGVSFIIYSCQNDDDFNKKQLLQVDAPEQKRVQINRGEDVSKKAIDYIKQKTNNTLLVEDNPDKISLYKWRNII